MSAPYLLGLDLGTSAVKALIVDAQGRVMGHGSAEYAIHAPQENWAEQDPAQWWQAVCIAVRVAVAMTNGENPIAAIGLSGQMHGTVLLGEGGELLAPAVIWPDQRSARQVREITELVGPERLIEVTGSPVATGFQAATLRWFQQQRPDLWQRVHQILLPKDYLRWRLTGCLAADPSDGSGALLLDVRRRDWSSELSDLLRIDLAHLPFIRPAQQVAGTLTPAAAADLGLPAGLAVVTGAADTACSALGAGVVEPDTLLLTISTGGQVVLPLHAVTVDRRGRVHTFCSALEPGSGQAAWYQMAAILSAGMALRWLRDQVFGLHGAGAYAQMTAWAAPVPPGAAVYSFCPI